MMLRRKFITQLSWITGGFLTGGIQTFLGFGKNKEIKGRITAATKGLPNVVISDGFNVVVSDKSGFYSLSLHKKARFITVSIPSGYGFPVEENIARHYIPVHQLSPKKPVNFELEQLSANDNEHQFIIWADTQVKNKNDVKRFWDESIPDVQELVAGLPAGTLMHGITVGDIVWDAHELYPEYNKAVNAVNIPFFQCLGNHDMDLNQGGDEASDRTFNEWYGPTYYSFNRGQVHYIVLDDVRYLGKNKEYDGHISADQLNWIKKDLEFVPNDKVLIICAHIPVLSSVKNKEALLDLVKDYTVHIMSGHTHRNFNTIENGVFEHNHGTVCGALWTGNICGDGTPNGYAVYTVKGRNISWYYKTTGKPSNYQGKLYLQEMPNGQKKVLANIWNHDPKWKIKAWIDEEPAVIKNVPGLDPLAIKLYDGPQLPLGRGYVDPRKTAHLFELELPLQYQSFRIEATDRFGNSYLIDDLTT